MPLSLEFWWLGLASYGVCHLVHLAWWQVRRPRRDILTLFVLFLGIPLPLAAATLGAAPLLIHFWLSAQYLAIYPAFQASSPTLHLVATLARSPEGMDEGVLMESTVGLDRHDEREKSLHQSGFLKEEGSLTASGKALARFFLAYRSWLGLSEGEG